MKNRDYSNAHALGTSIPRMLTTETKSSPKSASSRVSRIQPLLPSEIRRGIAGILVLVGVFARMSCCAYQFKAQGVALSHGRQKASACTSSFLSSVAPFRWNGDDDMGRRRLSIVSSGYSRPTSYYATIRGITTMGKGDGKRKRKKSSSSSSPSASPEEDLPKRNPQRVSTDINISVRTQIRWAQQKKEYEKNSGTAFRQSTTRRTSYRKSLDEEEKEEARIVRQKRGQEPEWDVILNATSVPPLVIIDAYNVIYKWPRLKKWMDKCMLHRAREVFIHDLEELRALKGWRIECVFDGYGRGMVGPLGNSPGSKEGKVTDSDQEAKKKVTTHGVRVVYSGVGMSADGYIESRCYDSKHVTNGQLTGSLIVVSDDGMIRMAGSNAGALCMSSGRLVEELKALKRSTMYKVEVAVARANGHEVRPIKLQGTIMPHLLRKGSIIIEDRRKVIKKNDTNKKLEPKVATLEDLKKGTTTVPSWAIVPKQTNT